MSTFNACSFPACDRAGHFPVRDADGERVAVYCRGHRPMREIPGYCDLYCQICGFGPRVTLDKHVIAFHDGTDVYRRQFGRDSLSSKGRRDNCRAVWDDHVEDGVISKKRRQRTCRNGHRLTKANTYVWEWEGQIVRKCRKCALEGVRRRRQRTRARRRPRKCRWCGGSFLPARKDSRFCSRTCRRRLESFKISKQYPDRQCDWCGQEFKPKMRTERFCSRPCRKQYIAKRHDPRPCRVCCEPFTPRRANHFVCSAECHAVAARARALTSYYRRKGLML